MTIKLIDPIDTDETIATIAERRATEMRDHAAFAAYNTLTADLDADDPDYEQDWLDASNEFFGWIEHTYPHLGNELGGDGEIMYYTTPAATGAGLIRYTVDPTAERWEHRVTWALMIEN